MSPPMYEQQYLFVTGHFPWWHSIFCRRPPWLAKQKQALPDKSLRVYHKRIVFFPVTMPELCFFSSERKNAWNGALAVRATRTCFRTGVPAWPLSGLCIVFVSFVSFVSFGSSFGSSFKGLTSHLTIPNRQLRPVLTDARLKGWRCSRCSSFTCCFGLFSIQPSTWRNEPLCAYFILLSSQGGNKSLEHFCDSCTKYSNIRNTNDSQFEDNTGTSGRPLVPQNPKKHKRTCSQFLGICPKIQATFFHFGFHFPNLNFSRSDLIMLIPQEYVLKRVRVFHNFGHVVDVKIVNAVVM